MSEQKLISVIMPVYNNQQYIAKAIESILQQTYTKFEFIIINDASTDNSLNIIHNYAKKDSRIHIINNQVNLGVTKSLNKGIKKASGDYIARMDSDDVSYKNRLELQALTLKMGFDVVGSNIELINGLDEIIGIREYSERPKPFITSPLAHPSVMFKKKLIKERAYNPEVLTGQDYDLWLYFYSKDAKFINIQATLLKYRLHDNTIKVQKTKQILRDTIKTKLRAQREYDVKFNIKAKIRLLLECCLLLLPSKVILWLFNKIQENGLQKPRFEKQRFEKQRLKNEIIAKN